MKEVNTTPGKTYAVTSPNGCTVTQHVGEATIVHDVPAGVQVLIIAQAARMEVSDDAAVVTECGGSAELVFTAATTRAASSGTGSDGMTAEERALLNGAAQRDADNTFSAGNTFTGAVDMSGAQVTPPEGWNVADLTPEAIQQVVPMAWSEWTTAPICTGINSIVIGDAAKTEGNRNITIGHGASDLYFFNVTIGNEAYSNNASISIGNSARSNSGENVAIGGATNATGLSSICVGYFSKTSKPNAVSLGARFTETTSDGDVSHTCTTEGTGSITIGAGANTLNNGDTESSNSVTIGCKALNQGADSVVLGAQAKATAGGTVAIGAGAEAADAGAVVFASYSNDRSYKTQLYFSGAGSALANTYANGEGIMGYVTTDSAGNVIASGYKKLSALFDEGSMTQPATLDEFGDWVMPKVFQPGKGEPQEYTPLPVYPIVEPEIPEMEEV